MDWTVEFRGGAYGGRHGALPFHEPPPLLVVWEDERGLVASFNPHHAGIRLDRVEAYRRFEVDLDRRHAVYEVGDSDPDDELVAEERERELVGTSMVEFSGHYFGG